ncbi:PAS domain-containing protein [Methylobacterium sp. WL120]|uniref:PAS domain-containing protein n=1 Tax=Methylobacterium sp. WL120 TaxID=2603887 RepID=UPI0011C7A408|nr:PAS domain-containing protein [Methylobacterium sp. WL120]TXM66806.1 PAS domain-containing protein [Methylobacterium sp. WL120]
MRTSDGTGVDPWRDKLQAALEDADAIGRWQVDARENLVTGDAMIAFLFGFTPKSADEGIPFETFNGGVHPEDRAQVMGQIWRCATDGGWFIAEHRVCSADGQTRRILARGKFDKDNTGTVVSGRGIVVDITRSEEGHSPLIKTSKDQLAMPLERATDFFLAGFRSLQEADEPKALALAETLLLELGRSLARAEVRARSAPLH